MDIDIALDRRAASNIVDARPFDDIEALQKKIAEKHGYEIQDHSLVIYVRPKKKG